MLDGRDMTVDQIAVWAHSADVVLVADGAINRLANSSISVHRVIGDFDSMEARHRDAYDLHHDPDDALSDCDKLLVFAEQEGYAAITLCSIEGDRLDHQLATLHSAAKSCLDVSFAYRTGLGRVLRGPGQWTFDVQLDRLFSLIPVTSSTRVSLDGVFWPLADVKLNPAENLSLSNRTTETSVNVSSASGILFAMFETDGMPCWA